MTNSEIAISVKLLFGAKFPLFQKCDVNGYNANEVFKFLRKKTPSMNKKECTRHVPWNFAKWLVDPDGNVIEYYNPMKSTK